MTTAIVEAQTDEGIHGFGTVGRGRFRLRARQEIVSVCSPAALIW